MSKTDPIRTTDEEARALAQRLILEMKHATLGTIDPETGTPLLTRIAIQRDRDGCPMALLSGLAAHSRALKADSRVGLMVADSVAKGDPMNQARLSILARATLAEPDAERRARWLENDPKATVYIDLPDFSFWRIEPVSGLLNAGFARAYRLDAADMLKTPEE
ncbi:HugZ family pyridoxamine 5'-phosphate oxidase [Paracoccus aminophilus]|uniref:Pyridoxamine 5'-phosphate domain-containing protein n=1 Tax=Paracoccus aminophilus JCM 7686 TaxID=1367847 RepID=S5XP49_PARAH|nr:pyridoxamine 5'-phosphate domain-containing protein [Paracoccus aminophilus]AGT09084.1 pyridoxamine 5'-phosphate domain-containing protein [Paracoccus aminophilus JCM 7686]